MYSVAGKYQQNLTVGDEVLLQAVENSVHTFAVYFHLLACVHDYATLWPEERIQIPSTSLLVHMHLLFSIVNPYVYASGKLMITPHPSASGKIVLIEVPL